MSLKPCSSKPPRCEQDPGIDLRSAVEDGWACSDDDDDDGWACSDDDDDDGGDGAPISDEIDSDDHSDDSDEEADPTPARKKPRR